MYRSIYNTYNINPHIIKSTANPFFIKKFKYARAYIRYKRMYKQDHACGIYALLLNLTRAPLIIIYFRSCEKRIRSAVATSLLHAI